jgi:hypothetical protein
LPQQRTEGGEPSAPATPGLLLLSYTTPRDAANGYASIRTLEAHGRLTQPST